jgi:hypothetical protein
MLINSKLPVFMNMTLSFKSSVVTDHTSLCMSVLLPLSKWHHLCTFSFLHNTFPIHFNKLAMDFGRANVFSHYKIESPNTPHNRQDWWLTMVLYKAHSKPIHSMAWKTVGACQRVSWQLSTFKNLWSMTCTTLKMILVHIIYVSGAQLMQQGTRILHPHPYICTASLKQLHLGSQLHLSTSLSSQADSTGDASNLYKGAAWFKSSPGHCLFWLKYIWINSRTVPWSRPEQLPPQSSKFHQMIIHSYIQC